METISAKQKEDLKTVQELDFFVQDLIEYLDTHPDDSEALNQYKTAVQKANASRKEYEATYGPLFIYDFEEAKDWSWGKTPWPWDM